MDSKNSVSERSLVIAAIGVVFGDIGTSPLYAIRECFSGHHALSISESNILGILSTLFWALVIIISIKYVMIVMRANNKGEGGVLALTALISRKLNRAKNSSILSAGFILLLGMFGTSLLYADGIITPAISVLGALEGLEVVTPVFNPYVVPAAIFILLILFGIQSRGTGAIGKFFGPVVMVWFLVIASLGTTQIINNPFVLTAINPLYAISFFYNEGRHALLSLGSLFLVVTGAEALYADMGHFGARPIKKAWLFMVLPCLVLNYFGQGALLLNKPEVISNPFYNLSPSWFLVPLVILATITSAIASQAIISGAFSLTRQGIQLGFLPRMQVNYTSEHHEGQIYIPTVNKLLCIGTIILVLAFRSSSNLAGAYGIGVSLDMLLTTFLLFTLARKAWRWKIFYLVVVFSFFTVVDLGFVVANSVKFFDGGWFTISIASLLVVVMTTWFSGRVLLAKRLEEKGVSWQSFMESIPENLHRVPGVAIFMTRSKTLTPIPLIHNLSHNQIMHEKVILLTIDTDNVPHVPFGERVEIEDLGKGIYRVLATIGFQDEADTGKILLECEQKSLSLEGNKTFFLGREILVATPRPGMALWREKLFALMSRNAERATAFYRVPSEQVFEVGIQVEL